MFNSCLVIGCGGIGQFVLPALCKLLYYHPNGTCDITIIDGDTYEPNNYDRQFVTKCGENKAIGLSKQLPNYVKVIPEFVNHCNVVKILNSLVPPVLVIPAVDNLATRHILIKNLDRLGIDYYWVCPGNEYESYQVSFHKGELFSHPFERYKNLAYPVDNLPGSCLEETPSSPQLIAANMSAAAATICYVTNILDNKAIPQEIMGNIRQLKHEGIGLYKDDYTEKN